MGKGLARALVLAPIAIASCALITPLDGLSGDASVGEGGADAGGEGGSDATTKDVSADAPADAPADGDAGRCPSGRGPAMTVVPFSSGTFCIDSTEVTQSQYAAFLNAGVSTSGQPARCANNSTYAPQFAGACLVSMYDPTGHPNDPVRCVDWCDAYAFCKWAGKRLCGNIGGGSADPNNGASTNAQWYFACSHGGTLAYPYGNTFDAGVCNGQNINNNAAAVPVKSKSGCVGGYGGIFDMSGNVSEYTDACTDAGLCPNHGGGYTELMSDLRCDYGSLNPTTYVGQSVGLRCCAD